MLAVSLRCSQDPMTKTWTVTENPPPAFQVSSGTWQEPYLIMQREAFVGIRVLNGHGEVQAL